MVIYNIQTNGESNQLVIEVISDSVYVESNSVAYITGNIEIDASAGGYTCKLKAHFIGKKYFKPRFHGTGKIYLRSTLGSYYKFTLKDEELIIGANAFIACRDSIKLYPNIQPSLNNFVSGVPMITTAVKGTGNVLVLMPGPVVENSLKDDKFVAFDTDIAAYSTSLKVTREFAGKGWLNVANKMVYKFRGTGSVFFTPNPNKDSKRKK